MKVPNQSGPNHIETDVIHRGDDAAAFVVPWILRYTSIAEYKKNQPHFWYISQPHNPPKTKLGFSSRWDLVAFNELSNWATAMILHFLLYVVTPFREPSWLT